MSCYLRFKKFAFPFPPPRRVLKAKPVGNPKPAPPLPSLPRCSTAKRLDGIAFIEMQLGFMEDAIFEAYPDQRPTKPLKKESGLTGLESAETIARMTAQERRAYMERLEALYFSQVDQEAAADICYADIKTLPRSDSDSKDIRRFVVEILDKWLNTPELGCLMDRVSDDQFGFICRVVSYYKLEKYYGGLQLIAYERLLNQASQAQDVSQLRFHSQTVRAVYPKTEMRRITTLDVVTRLFQVERPDVGNTPDQLLCFVRLPATQLIRVCDVAKTLGVTVPKCVLNVAYEQLQRVAKDLEPDALDSASFMTLVRMAFVKGSHRTVSADFFQQLLPWILRHVTTFEDSLPFYNIISPIIREVASYPGVDTVVLKCIVWFYSLSPEEESRYTVQASICKSLAMTVLQSKANAQDKELPSATVLSLYRFGIETYPVDDVDYEDVCNLQTFLMPHLTGLQDLQLLFFIFNEIHCSDTFYKVDFSIELALKGLDAWGKQPANDRQPIARMELSGLWFKLSSLTDITIRSLSLLGKLTTEDEPTKQAIQLHYSNAPMTLLSLINRVQLPPSIKAFYCARSFSFNDGDLRPSVMQALSTAFFKAYEDPDCDKDDLMCVMVDLLNDRSLSHCYYNLVDWVDTRFKDHEPGFDMQAMALDCIDFHRRFELIGGPIVKRDARYMRVVYSLMLGEQDSIAWDAHELVIARPSGITFDMFQLIARRQMADVSADSPPDQIAAALNSWCHMSRISCNMLTILHLALPGMGSMGDFTGVFLDHGAPSLQVELKNFQTKFGTTDDDSSVFQRSCALVMQSSSNPTKALAFVAADLLEASEGLDEPEKSGVRAHCAIALVRLMNYKEFYDSSVFPALTRCLPYLEDSIERSLVILFLAPTAEDVSTAMERINTHLKSLCEDPNTTLMRYYTDDHISTFLLAILKLFPRLINRGTISFEDAGTASIIFDNLASKCVQIGSESQAQTFLDFECQILPIAHNFVRLVYRLILQLDSDTDPSETDYAPVARLTESLSGTLTDGSISFDNRVLIPDYFDMLVHLRFKRYTKAYVCAKRLHDACSKDVSVAALPKKLRHATAFFQREDLEQAFLTPIRRWLHIGRLCSFPPFPSVPSGYKQPESYLCFMILTALRSLEHAAHAYADRMHHRLTGPTHGIFLTGLFLDYVQRRLEAEDAAETFDTRLLVTLEQMMDGLRFIRTGLHLAPQTPFDCLTAEDVEEFQTDCIQVRGTVVATLPLPNVRRVNDVHFQLTCCRQALLQPDLTLQGCLDIQSRLIGALSHGLDTPYPHLQAMVNDRFPEDSAPYNFYEIETVMLLISTMLEHFIGQLTPKDLLILKLSLMTLSKTALKRPTSNREYNLRLLCYLWAARCDCEAASPPIPAIELCLNKLVLTVKAYATLRSPPPITATAVDTVGDPYSLVNKDTFPRLKANYSYAKALIDVISFLVDQVSKFPVDVKVIAPLQTLIRCIYPSLQSISEGVITSITVFQSVEGGEGVVEELLEFYRLLLSQTERLVSVLEQAPHLAQCGPFNLTHILRAQAANQQALLRFRLGEYEQAIMMFRALMLELSGKFEDFPEGAFNDLIVQALPEDPQALKQLTLAHLSALRPLLHKYYQFPG